MAVTVLAPDAARHAMASRPDRHVWVAASAGTGKTTALVDRVTRLLLAGAAPESLVAITFTRTAAAEMQERVMTRLAGWVRMPDAELADALARLGETPEPGLVARARGLFARLLEAPGGLRIQTIHALAQALLAAFPLEAGLFPGVVALDERGAADLRARALADVLHQAQDNPRLAADCATIAVAAGEQGIAAQVARLAAAGDAFASIGGTQAVEPWLRAWLGLARDGTRDELLEKALARPELEEAVANFAACMDAYGTEAKAQVAARARGWLALDAAGRLAALATLHDFVLTKNGKPRAFGDVAKKAPEIEEAAGALLKEVEQLRDLERALAFVEVAGAWLRFGMALADSYDARKAAAASIDYDDMIRRAARLLQHDGMLSFVNWKLDQRIGHLLVDEAQDTNAAQWALIEGLSADFDSGEGGHGAARRTRFVVGDFKQAIYGFQGTDPGIFAAKEQAWQAAATGLTPFESVPLDRNFRSAPIILRLVDEVLERIGPQGLGLPAGTILRRHEAARAGVAGRVWLLPEWRADEQDGAEAAGIEQAEEDEEAAAASPAYAEMLAGIVSGLVRPGSPDRLVLDEVPGRRARRHATAGDVLILVQARGDLMAQLVGALHRAGLPVSGVDRMLLMEPLAVRDCLSVIRFVLQPADDLALAEVLTSPLGGLDHEAVRRLRHVQGTPGHVQGTLWEAVRASAEPVVARPRAFLEQALRMADQAGPHAFLQALLDAHGGRRLLLERLGLEAADHLDALLAQALAFEASQPATLAGFLRWLGEGAGDVKRDPEAAGGQVRIMTVHGAKGLQAPIVLLADATRGAGNRARQVDLPVGDGMAALPLIYGKADRCPARVDALARSAEDAEKAERRRLLYVALTRAEDMLVVAGVAPGKEPGEPHWHRLVAEAMQALGAAAQEGGRLELADPMPDPPASRPEAAPTPAQPLPPWARDPAPAEARGVYPFTPSAPGPDPSG
ncbi:MAG: UvrD-helicase domain-containing protein, partial [Sphingomonadaceae bacterium]